MYKPGGGRGDLQISRSYIWFKTSFKAMYLPFDRCVTKDVVASGEMEYLIYVPSTPPPSFFMMAFKFSDMVAMSKTVNWFTFCDLGSIFKIMGGNYVSKWTCLCNISCNFLLMVFQLSIDKRLHCLTLCDFASIIYKRVHYVSK